MKRLDVVEKSKPLTTLLEEQGPFDVQGDAEQLKAARLAWAAFRQDNGYSGYARLLTPPEGNLKLSKLSSMTLPNYGLTLAAADASGIDACVWRTPLCTSACVLVTAGKATMPSVRKARNVKTQFLAQHPQHFVLLLSEEIRKEAAKRPIAVRLNVASDVRWERVAPGLFETPGVTFYDYTKAPASQRDDLGGRYRLTYSVSERPKSESEALEWLARGGSAAVVFDTPKGQALPATWNGYRVVDADEQDGRYADPPGSVAGLRAKGAARGGKAAGFVKRGVSS